MSCASQDVAARQHGRDEQQTASTGAEVRLLERIRRGDDR
jgi:hypothetical protein